MSTSAAISAYNKIGIESGVAAADPHKLISMLYQGAQLAIANGKNGILRQDIAAKGKAISHAILIIDSGLNASLNKEVGGDLALNLSALYDYMSQRLLIANLNNDLAALDEVAGLLAGLKEAWDSIRPQAIAATAPPMLEQGERRLYARG
ncbi:MAG: flagellar export chaperone FliS [Gallionella sp.]|jgi:flagellar protein FliS